MADEITGLLAQWIKEAKAEIAQLRKDHGTLEEKHNDLKVEHERLKTKINTRTAIIWSAISLAIALGGFALALLKLITGG